MEQNSASNSLNSFTVFCRASDDRGTTYITCVEAADIESGKQLALEECALNWGQTNTDDIRILGVAEGDVNILDWDDLDS